MSTGHKIKIVSLVVHQNNRSTFSGCPQDFLVVQILKHKNMERQDIFIFQNKLILKQWLGISYKSLAYFKC